MKLTKLTEQFENFFSWNENEIENNKDEIILLMEKLRKKRKTLERKIKKEPNKEEQKILKDKLKAVIQIIKKAKKSFY